MRFRITPLLKSALESTVEHAAEDTADAFRHSLREGSIEIADVRQLSSLLLSRHAQAMDDGKAIAAASPLYVHELLAGAAPILPERAAKPPPHPSLAPRLEALRAAQEDREYAKLIGGSLGRDDTSVGRDEAEMATYRSQLGVGVNLIVSMATMFIVGAYAGGVEGEPFLGVRATVCGLALMLLTMAVEMSLFLIGAIRVDQQVHNRELRAKKGVRDRTKLAQHATDFASSGDNAVQHAKVA